MPKITVESIRFERDGNLFLFVVKHNLENFGLSLSAELSEWLLKSKNCTAKDLCEHIESKNPGIVCKPVNTELAF